MVKKHGIRIVLFLSSFYGYTFANNSDSTITRQHKFAIHHEIVSPLIYQLALGGNNNHTETFAWKYFTGGFRYKISNKYELSLDYLFFEKQINSTNTSLNTPTFFGSIVIPDGFYTAQNHLYKQKYIWLSLRRNIKKFYGSLGFGIGSNSYSNNYNYNSVNEKNRDWCNVIDFGYKINLIKRLSLTPYLGLLTAFSYKKEIIYEKPVLYKASDLYDYESKSDKDLKKVEIQGSNKVVREYSYLGIMKSKLIPRIGVSIDFNF